LNFKGILFDLDGTILDTSNLIISSFQHTFRVHYNRELAPHEIHVFFGKTLRSAMEALGPGKVEELINTYREHNLQHHDQMVTAFPGVVETIQKLYNAGLVMAIVTSKTQQTAIRGLKLFDLAKYFSAVIGVEQCQNHKPHPEPVITALKQIGLSANECLMVGDSPADLNSARQAGVKTAAVRWTHVKWEKMLAETPDYIINSMEQLLSICEKNR